MAREARAPGRSLEPESECRCAAPLLGLSVARVAVDRIVRLEVAAVEVALRLVDHVGARAGVGVDHDAVEVGAVAVPDLAGEAAGRAAGTRSGLAPAVAGLAEILAVRLEEVEADLGDDARVGLERAARDVVELADAAEVDLLGGSRVRGRLAVARIAAADDSDLGPVRSAVRAGMEVELPGRAAALRVRPLAAGLGLGVGGRADLAADGPGVLAGARRVLGVGTRGQAAAEVQRVVA